MDQIRSRRGAEIYRLEKRRDDDGRFRWALYAKNNHVIAEGPQRGYDSRRRLDEALDSVLKGFTMCETAENFTDSFEKATNRGRGFTGKVHGVSL